MKVLIHDFSGHAFTIQLARELAKNNISIKYVYSNNFQAPKGTLEDLSTDPVNLKITGIDLKTGFKKYSYISRFISEQNYSRLYLKEIQSYSPDVILSSQPTLFIHRKVQRYCRSNNCKYILWVQDLIGVGLKKIFDKKYFFLGKFIGRFFINLEKRVLVKSDELILISDSFLNYLNSYKIDKSNIHIIRNWASLKEIPLSNKENEWSIKNNCVDSFNFLYAGTLGLKHDSQKIVDLSNFFKDNNRIKIIVVSEGLGADNLKEISTKHNLDNLICINYVTQSDFPQVLASADVLVGLLTEEAGEYSVPSKILSYFCSGKPVLLIAPLENLISKIITENKAGIVISPDDTLGFHKAASLLLNDSVLAGEYGSNGREYAELNFNIQNIVTEFKDIFSST